MLIEIARQAMYHYVYSTTDFHRGEVSISMGVFEGGTPLLLVISAVLLVIGVLEWLASSSSKGGARIGSPDGSVLGPQGK
ncbi:hypothetical protein [Paraburkholderia sp. MM5384-R2]|uniref:hypothetical protein n=1 Tax=Paraburkholderia sp. MM5384-R2 TaxID=2723097 RepID=UPI00161B89BE|nr:hypothetical protein [Paraburkholderia sp. MM5384-R2]MBB5503007.1 hypothetical protein [Paraburkholderia sp. MM5384-R2]